MGDLVIPNHIAQLFHRQAQFKVLLKAYKDIRTTERELIQACKTLFKEETNELKAYCEANDGLQVQGELAKYLVSIKPIKAKSIKIDLHSTVALIESTLNDANTNKDQMKDIIRVGLAAKVKLPKEDTINLRHVRISIRKIKKATNALYDSINARNFTLLFQDFQKTTPMNDDEEDEEDGEEENEPNAESDEEDKEELEHVQVHGNKQEEEEEDRESDNEEEEEQQQVKELANEAIEQIQTRSSRKRSRHN